MFKVNNIVADQCYKTEKSKKITKKANIHIDYRKILDYVDNVNLTNMLKKIGILEYLIVLLMKPAHKSGSHDPDGIQ